MERFIIKGDIVTQDRILKGAKLLIDGSKIVGITCGPAFFRNAKKIFLKNSLILPGFIDLHIHGNPIKISNREVRFGTTSFLYTIHPGPLEGLRKEILEFVNLERAGLKATPLGIHLEGPYVNKDMAGGLNRRFLRPPNNKEVLSLIKIANGAIRLITLSPELKQIEKMMGVLKENKINVSIGHSSANFIQTEQAIDSGASHATHLFNRMRQIESREPGVLGAVLSDKRVSVDFILDGIHVHPSLFKIALACKGIENVILITDSLCSLEEEDLIKINGLYKDRYGKIKGSRLTMNRAVENAIRFGGIDIVDAIMMASLNPAKVLKIEDRKGSLDVGKDADIVIVDKELNVRLTMVEGRIEYVRDSRVYR